MDSISLVLDFTSCLLERGENPFGKALVEMKGTWLESFFLFLLNSGADSEKVFKQTKKEKTCTCQALCFGWLQIIFVLVHDGVHRRVPSDWQRYHDQWLHVSRQWTVSWRVFFFVAVLV